MYEIFDVQTPAGSELFWAFLQTYAPQRFAELRQQPVGLVANLYAAAYDDWQQAQMAAIMYDGNRLRRKRKIQHRFDKVQEGIQAVFRIGRWRGTEQGDQ